jgi:hypothetical protein
MQTAEASGGSRRGARREGLHVATAPVGFSAQLGRGEPRPFSPALSLFAGSRNARGGATRLQARRSDCRQVATETKPMTPETTTSPVTASGAKPWRRQARALHSQTGRRGRRTLLSFSTGSVRQLARPFLVACPTTCEAATGSPFRNQPSVCLTFARSAARPERKRGTRQLQRGVSRLHSRCLSANSRQSASVLSGSVSVDSTRMFRGPVPIARYTPAEISSI